MSHRNPARRMQVFDSLLGLFPPGRVVDLGAGHGKFSMRAADLGWTATAVDARDERFVEDPRVTWIQQDVREADLTGYDLILCLGLYYHLTLDDQRSFLQRAAGTPLILDTHIATDAPTHPLSDEIEVEGYRGRYYDEGKWEGRTTASWNNTKSFWPTPDALYALLAENGYSTVLATSPWVTPDRTFWLSLPEGYSR